MRVLRIVVLASVMLLWLVPSASAQAGLELTTDYPTVAVERGESVSFSLDVTAPAVTRVDLQIVEVPEGWTATLRGGGFVIGAVTAGPEPPSVTLDVDVPPDADEGTYEVLVRARGGGDEAELPLRLRVADVAGGTVELNAEFPSLTGASDATFRFDLELVNNTPEETTFSLEAAGPEGWITSARPSGEQQASTATVAGGDSTTITVEADPPDDTPAGTYPVAVRAAGGGRTAEAELQVEITGNFALTLTTPDERLNASVTAGGSEQLTLLVVSDGTAPLAGIELSATPPTDWEVTFAPEAIPQLAPGETAEVTATITPAGDAVAGDYVVTLEARVPEVSDSVEIRTTVETSRLWGVVGIGLIGLALGGLAWVFQRFGRR